MDRNRGIGKNNQTPWHISSDLNRFKSLTLGHHIIMGRKTYESIGRQLPGRSMIILSGRPDYVVDGAVVLHSLEDALRYAEAQGESEAFVIGGGDIFEQSMKYADRIYLTSVEASVDADVFFPHFKGEDWETKQDTLIDQRNGDQYAYRYMILERKQKPAELKK
jgi:dihydrofolate reductase